MLRQSKRRGFAIPLAVVAVMILLALGVGLLSLGLHSRIYAIRVSSDIAARCAADAGLVMALFEMNQKLQVKPFSEDTLPQATDVKLPYSDQVCSYKMTGDLSSGYTIESIGTCGLASRTVRATIGLKGVFDHAIFTKETLWLKAGTRIDAYNSVDPLASNSKVTIGTRSTSDASVVLNNTVTVNGDVAVGIGGNPKTAVKDLGATITGDVYAATMEEPLPHITAPALSKKGTSITTKGGTVVITPADSGAYTAIDIKKGTTTVKGAGKVEVPTALEVTGGDVVLHITGNIELDQACDIIVKDGSSLTLYVDGNIQCREGSGINTENPPEKAATLKLYATGEGKQLFDVKAKSAWTGVIYAPNADVDLYAGGDAYGAVVADSFEFKNGGNYHYDEALRKVSVEDEGVRFVVKRWYEGDI